MNFESIKENAKKEWLLLTENKEPVIYIGTATCGRSAGALAVLEALKKEEGINNTRMIETGCLGPCHAEPVIMIKKDERPLLAYGKVKQRIATRLVLDYLNEDKIDCEFVLGTVGSKQIDGVGKLFDLPVLKPQVRRILKNCGFIDPENINHYIANGGYTGLQNALGLKPNEIIEKVKASGLRGRGGAGFPTWKKWETAWAAANEQETTNNQPRAFIICNADEGDPGAFMNRSLLEGDPHSVLEGMLIAGYTIGATEGYIYCRAEYPLALARLKTALNQMRDLNLLGENILGTDFCFDLHIKEGAGAFVCGEETALIASIEGKRGNPRPRPPFPAQVGLWDKPTVINNVETFANVALILNNGPEWFAEYGTETSRGTKTFSLAGKIQHPSLIEVPLGITLKEIIYDIGGGPSNGKNFKAVQTGGPSGGCLNSEMLDLPIDYDSLEQAGAIMGSGGLVVMDEDTCMVDIARYFLEFTQKESCGKCVPCRLGTKAMLDILNKITGGMGEEEDLTFLRETGVAVQKGSLCGLGKTAPNPVLSTYRYFREEYEAHIKYKKCPAVVCKKIISSPCQHACPISQDAACYIALIAEGNFAEAARVAREKNPLPGICGRVCHHPCEEKCVAGEDGNPINIRALKRFLADWERKNSKKLEVQNNKTTRAGYQSPDNGLNVAIIGSGPAGLSCAWALRKKGYSVTIFERNLKPGGLLAYGIPEYRLPEDIMREEVESIINTGVEIKTGVEGNVHELKKQFPAVFVASGSPVGIKLGIPGEESPAVLDAISYLKNPEQELGKRVLVIGGGNAAIDAARTARRKDKEVTIIYRRTRKEMPAIKSEIEGALEEGIEFLFLTAPVRILPENVLECIKNRLGEFDKSGRARPVPITGSEFKISFDTIISAVGQKPEISLQVDPETLYTGADGVFAGGDVITGPATVTEAIAHGMRAAESIDRYLKNRPLTREYDVTRPLFIPAAVELSDEDIENQKPVNPWQLTPEERINNFIEIEKCYTAEEAIAEAKRCLRCDLAAAEK